MTISITTVFLASLVNSTMTESQRLEALKSYFDPPVGSRVTFDTRYEKGIDRIGETLRKVNGHITVKPPEGQCFIIKKSDQEPDIRLCKEKKVYFDTSHIQADGTLRWEVDTGKDDFGTPLVWNTDYRLGKFVDLRMEWPGPSSAFVIEKCRAVHSLQKGRKIFLKLLTGEEWVIKLPEEDHLVEQPVFKPGLEKEKGTKGGLRTQTVNRNHLIKLVNPDDYDKHRSGEWVPIWRIPLENAFEMSSSNFMPYGDKPAGAKSKCRYRFEGLPSDPDSGLLECHNTSRFKWVYTPVPCLSDLKPYK